MSTLSNGDKEFIEDAVLDVLRREFVKIVSAIGALLMVQFGGAVWWASSLTNETHKNREEVAKVTRRVEQHDTRFEQIDGTRYRDRDAIKDFALRDQRITQLEKSLSEIRIALSSISKDLGSVSQGIKRLEEDRRADPKK